MRNGVLLLIFSLSFITPTNATTTWGIEINEDYKFELKSFKIGITDYTLLLKENLSFIVEFTSLTDIGYSYDVYNSTGLMTTNTTNFVKTEVEAENYTIPDGLPIALPLAIGTIPDYLDYFGDFVNATSSIFIFEDLLENMTDYLNATYMCVYSLLNENYLKLQTDLYAPTVNNTLLEELTGGEGMEMMPIPTNITDLKLNATVAYNVTSGLFKQLTIKLRSLSHTGDFTENFNVDVIYGLYIPPPPVTPTPTPTPTDKTSYSWLIPAMLVLTLLTGIKLKRKKK